MDADAITIPHRPHPGQLEALREAEDLFEATYRKTRGLDRPEYFRQWRQTELAYQALLDQEPAYDVADRLRVLRDRARDLAGPAN